MQTAKLQTTQARLLQQTMVVGVAQVQFVGPASWAFAHTPMASNSMRRYIFRMGGQYKNFLIIASAE
jgi:hypothetical protein